MIHLKVGRRVDSCKQHRRLQTILSLSLQTNPSQLLFVPVHEIQISDHSRRSLTSFHFYMLPMCSVWRTISNVTWLLHYQSCSRVSQLSQIMWLFPDCPFVAHWLHVSYKTRLIGPIFLQFYWTLFQIPFTIHTFHASWRHKNAKRQQKFGLIAPFGRASSVTYKYLRCWKAWGYREDGVRLLISSPEYWAHGSLTEDLTLQAASLRTQHFRFRACHQPLH